MKVVNYNDLVRKSFIKKMKISKDKRILNISELYKEVSRDTEKYKYLYSVLALTTYIVNSYIYSKYPDDDNIQSSLSFYENLSNLDEFIGIVDESMFELLCNNLVYFENLDRYSKKEFIYKASLNKDKIIDILPNMIYDLYKYNVKYTTDIFIDKYNSILKETNDKKTALYNTAFLGTSFLIDIEKYDLEDYKNIISELVDKFYYYNKYKLSQNININENSLELIDMIENNINDFTTFSIENKLFLNTIIKDFLNYKLMDKEEKEKFNSFENEMKNKSIYKKRNYKTYNRNQLVRKCLAKYLDKDFIDSLSSYNWHSKTAKESLDKIRNSDNYDEIARVLYNDVLSFYYYDNITLDTLDINNDLNYLEDLYDIEAFKELMEDDEELELSLNDSISFYYITNTEKRNMIETLFKNKHYDDFLVNNYTFDMLEFAREYEVEDAANLYYDVLEDEKDIDVTKATCEEILIEELECLKLYYYDNYKRVFAELSKLFYNYNKYLLDYGYSNSHEKENIMKLMEKDINLYYSISEQNSKITEFIVESFYDLISLNNYKKQGLMSYFENINTKDKTKKLDKKNKNSN